MGDTRPGPGITDPNAEPEDRLEPVRLLVGGDKRAAIRRILLYIIVAVAVIVGGSTSVGVSVAIFALRLLAMTDKLA